MPNVIAEIGPIHVSDVTGQKAFRLRNVPSDITVLEMMKNLVGDMNMPTVDGSGRPVNYHVRLDREERLLGDLERVSDALRPEDSIRLLPNIDAGAIR